MMDFPAFDGTEPCAQIGLELYFPDGETSTSAVAAAKKLCGTCPMQAECLEWGLRHEQWGIWGGTNREERAALRRRRGIVLQTLDVDEWIPRRAS